jgi:predicted ATPase
MRDGYEELGYRIVEPKAPVAERLAFVKDVIAHA